MKQVLLVTCTVTALIVGLGFSELSVPFSGLWETDWVAPLPEEPWVAPNPMFVTVDVDLPALPTIPSDDEITIGWSTTQVRYGSHSIHVEATAATTDYAMVGVPTDFMLIPTTEISYWGYTVAGDVMAPDEIFLFLDTNADNVVDTILAATSALGTKGEWVQWTLAGEANWYAVAPLAPVPALVSISAYYGSMVLGIALGAGSPIIGSHHVDVYLDNLVVNGVTFLDDDTGTIEVLSKTIGVETFTRIAKDAPPCRRG